MKRMIGLGSHFRGLGQRGALLGLVGVAILSALFLSAADPSSAATPASCGSEQYLAEYFNNRYLSGTPTLTRCETSIDYQWGRGGPEVSLPSNQFSARWIGSFDFAAGGYLFQATADDGIRVWVDGSLLIDGWKSRAGGFQASANLSAGLHSVKVEYYENAGDAAAKLAWQPMGTPSPTAAPPTGTASATPAPPTSTTTATRVPPTWTPTSTPVPPTSTAVPPTATAAPPTATAAPPTATATTPPTATATALPSAPTPGGLPRVNVRPAVGTIDSNWARAPLFWFGKATDRDNYVDVRVLYDGYALYVQATVVDYYLWNDGSGSSDPRQYDALDLYISTGSSRAAAPQPGDYLFVSGFRGWPTTNDPRWHRQAQGTGSGWDYSWSPGTAWRDYIGLRYYNSGPNNNSDRDAGWTTGFIIPWSTLGLSGPPPAGSLWGLGMLLHDRDEPAPAGMGASPVWPGSFSASAPSSWGSLAFDPPAYSPPSVPTIGTTVVRRGLNGSVVSDAYVGGGGTCGGGIFGGGDAPHPSTTDLFVQNQSDVSDFPCFSKSYFQFDLSGVPAGKVILSATLRLHQFGGSDPTRAQPSLVQLFAVGQPWSEATLTWNNAPIAQENVSATQVNVLPGFPGWPGVPYDWNATKAVAEGYAAGKPANLVLYSADTAYHSGKYFTSSETGDWNAAGRPTLSIVWGDKPS